jgi:transcriptional regulator with PAS, ATPase and Fis domain
VAPTDAAVVITGETGTGKELCAREIHNHSRRRRGPFVALNCGAIPREIIESLLFGHERGAFTGAMERQLGLFEQANAGTIFLDEIGEMPSELQTRLLRVLETGTIRRIGGREEIPVDVRVIAATNRNLRRMVEEETFREDLFYRIYIFPIDLPPLRERKDEIPALARHLTGCLFSSGEEIELTGGAVKKLCEHTWPGNVRELKNALVRAAVQADGKSIDCRHIKLFSCGGPSGEGGEFAKNERAFLEAALAENDYNITKTAIRIKVARSSLQNKIKRLEIHMPKNP